MLLRVESVLIGESYDCGLRRIEQSVDCLVETPLLYGDPRDLQMLVSELPLVLRRHG
jgi:hypothetical protein